MAKYTINFKKNVPYPDVSKTTDVDQAHIFSNDALLSAIDVQVIDNNLQHPLYEADGSINEKNLANLKKKARYVVSFPCEAGKELDKDTYGILATIFDGPKKNCSEDGKYTYSASLKDGRFVFLPDPFAGSKDRILKPNLTVNFEEISPKQFNILYNLSMSIELEIKCKNNMEIINLPAFIKKPGRDKALGLNVPYADNTATFLVSTDDKWTKVHTTYEYGILKDTILTRSLAPASVNNRRRNKIYEWLPIPGKDSPFLLLRNEDYVPFEPITIDEFELITFDDTGKAIIPKHGLPNIGEADNANNNTLKKKLNNLISQFLNLRIRQLQNTLLDEVKRYYEGNNKEIVIELLEKCETTIQVSGFEIVDIDNDIKGLYIGQPESVQYSGPTEYKYVFIKTEQDILDLFTLGDMR